MELYRTIGLAGVGSDGRQRGPMNDSLLVSYEVQSDVGRQALQGAVSPLSRFEVRYFASPDFAMARRRRAFLLSVGRFRAGACAPAGNFQGGAWRQRYAPFPFFFIPPCLLWSNLMLRAKLG